MTESWIETFTGRRFHLLEPEPEDVCIEDIAHALANQCRYNGHCVRFYSVAEHCVLVAQALHEETERIQLLGLLHDAEEAYMGDIVKPVKVILPGTEQMGRIISGGIYAGLNIFPPTPEERHIVKYADNLLLATEANALLPSHGWGWKDLPAPDGDIEIVGWLPDEAERRYLKAYQELDLQGVLA